MSSKQKTKQRRNKTNSLQLAVTAQSHSVPSVYTALVKYTGWAKKVSP